MKTPLERTIFIMLLAGAGAVLNAQVDLEPATAPPAPAAPVARPARPAPPARPARPAMFAAQAAPTPMAAPAPMPAPAPAAAPLPPEPPDPWAPAPAAALQDWQVFSPDWQDRVNEAAQRAADKAMEAQDKILEAQSKAWAFASDAANKPFNFNLDLNLKGPLFAPQPRVFVTGPRGKVGNVDSLYERGRRDLDNREWDQAVNAFTEVAGRAGAHADASLYWKAYALQKLGRRDEALATIADLRKTFASSRWLDDAAALEVEVKQSAGGTVAPDSTNDDEIKLLALNGLMQSDPDRAYPYLEKLLRSPVSPRLKEQTLYVLAQSSAPKAQQALLQIAKGGGNPDLQLYAIRYLAAANRRQGNATNNQTLFEIYNSSNDTAVKREILNDLAGLKDSDHLVQIARNEKNHDLQIEALRRLGGMSAQPAVADALVAIYASSQDKDTKREVINILAGQHNAKSLVDLGRKEKDLDMKKTIVERVVNMNTPESKTFLEDILK